MKALTLWQPWASLVAHGYKRIETRSWRPSRRLIGARIAIHAGVRDPLSWDWWGADCGAPNYGLRDAVVEMCIDLGVVAADLPLGAVLAVARLNGLTPTQYLTPTPRLDRERPLGDFTGGRWAWHLTVEQVLREPFPVRGRQGLWECEIPLLYVDARMPVAQEVLPL